MMPPLLAPRFELIRFRRRHCRYFHAVPADADAFSPCRAYAMLIRCRHAALLPPPLFLFEISFAATLMLLERRH